MTEEQIEALNKVKQFGNELFDKSAKLHDKEISNLSNNSEDRLIHAKAKEQSEDSRVMFNMIIDAGYKLI